MERVIAVILAGGKGERLFPLSTPERPKQFLKLLGERSLLQQTADRLQWLVEPENRIAVTVREYKKIAKDQFNGEIVVEPEGKGTFLSVLLCLTKYGNPDDVMIVLPADHYIRDESRYRKELVKAVLRAKDTKHVVLIGEKARKPETDYGYIRHKRGKVVGFEEKPSKKRAIELMKEEAAWNCGIFVFRKSIMREVYERLYPEYTEMMIRSIEKAYENIRGGSFEKKVIERITNLSLIPASFGWCDIGRLDRLEKVRGEGSATKKQVNAGIDQERRKADYGGELRQYGM